MWRYRSTPEVWHRVKSQRAFPTVTWLTVYRGQAGWSSVSSSGITCASEALRATRAVIIVGGLPRSASGFTKNLIIRFAFRQSHICFEINTYSETYLLCLAMRFRETLDWYKFAGMMQKSQTWLGEFFSVVIVAVIYMTRRASSCNSTYYM